MKKYVMLFFLMMISPTLSWAAVDSCTDTTRKLYTVDKRCYVTDEQKKIAPYNAVVRIQTDSGRCTGTIVKSDDKDKKLYVYTAKHCVAENIFDKDDKTKITGEIIYPTIDSIYTQDGKTFSASRNNVGNKIIPDKESREIAINDWAIYTLNVPEKDKENVKSVKISEKQSSGAKVIGYGSLKIMSDKDIENFKKDYINYLKEQQVQDDVIYTTDYGWDDKGGLEKGNRNVRDFIDNLEQTNKTYYQGIFQDEKNLKVSECKYFVTTEGCQTWSGNSGGGVFDNVGNLIGIHVTGQQHIGGTLHAADSGNVPIVGAKIYKQDGGSEYAIAPTTDLPSDSCSTKEEYTVDKRCYATKEEMKIAPYNAVVGIFGSDGNIKCTGTIVRDDANNLLVYTAEPCVKNNKQNPISVKKQDGETISAEYIKPGVYYVPRSVINNNNNKIVLRDLKTDEKVGILDTNGDLKCTGDLAEDTLRVTAKTSCVLNDENLVRPTIVIKRPNGDNEVAERTKERCLVDGDCTYSIIMKYNEVSNVAGAVKMSGVKSDDSTFYKARVIGYSNLKIMSDKDIDNFKQNYTNYLKNQKGVSSDNVKNKEYGWTKNDGIDARYANGFINYIKQNNVKYYNDIFGTGKDKLKVSKCSASKTQGTQKCQAWAEGLGSGIFDSTGRMMGFVNGVNYTISKSDKHAGIKQLGFF